MNTQKLQVLNRLKKTKNGITSWEAIQDFGITRLAARIADLKDDSHKIEKITETNDGKNYARYFLISEAL